MTLCPIALMAGCKKCPFLAICPLKSVIGDYPITTEPQSQPDHGKGRDNAKPE